ncbi:hypothetical protein KKC32_02535 [Patescibacteria group bacterium]|nr:hypothetical protein [Patescibacteria group bacterium]
MTKRHLVLIIIFSVILLFGILITVRFVTGEDTWICKNGEWIKHGHPSAPQPETPCLK